MKEILDTPPRSVIDFYIDVFVEICHTFRPGKDAQAVNSSKDWLVQCLQLVPINVFTDDEKQRLVSKFTESEDSAKYLESELNILY